MTLKRYQEKRDFSKTPEPKGNTAQTNHFRFVIQKHAASHLHYDFRLELDGVLKSWAVPKGPSLDPEVKRLAMEVEDHPIDYGKFEGIIPKGQYGGGTVMLWDEGHWRPLDDNPEKAYQKGHLRFELEAHKLNGRWDLIRFKEKHWFLIKYNDAFAKAQTDYDITEALTRSVQSNQTMDEIAKHYEAVWTKTGKKATKQKKTKKSPEEPTLILPKGLTPSPFPDFIKPALATLVDEPPAGDEWLHEIKLDGYRILAFKQGSDIQLKSRNNINWTTELAGIAEALAELKVNHVVLDGEVVMLDKQSKSDFQLLQNAIKAGKTALPLVYFVFDILYLDQYSLTHLPLIERKALLKALLTAAPAAIRYNDHLLAEGKPVFEKACELALEGIVSKLQNSPYLSRRSKAWLKIKCLKRQELVIGGYSPPQGTRSHFGSLFLGYYNDQGKLLYAGNVGTGFTSASLTDVYDAMQAHVSPTNPFTTTPPNAKKATWLRPQLIAEVEFTEWTKDGHLRHPSFKGLRTDKQASEVRREEPKSLEYIKTPKAAASKTAQAAKPTIGLTHPDKMLYPDDNISKQDLYRYYETVASHILPFIVNRPLTLLRCPTDYSNCFYQRHLSQGTPKTLKGIDDPLDKHDQYLYITDEEGLLSLVQMGVLEIHPWGSTIANLDYADRLIFDLDPAPDVPWKTVVSAALDIKGLLESQLNLQSFVKTTGGKGLHVVIPIEPAYDWASIKTFSQLFVQYLEQIKPEQYIANMTKSKRKGKLFVDYLRNQRTATAIGTYSTRARQGAPVSVPLGWHELSPNPIDNRYTIASLPRRLAHLKKDPWADFFSLRQRLPLDDLEP